MNFLSKNLKYLRQMRGLNQKEISEKIGLRPNTVSNYEKGVSEPDINTINKIIKILEVDVHTLLYIDIESIIKEKGMNKEAFFGKKMSLQQVEKEPNPASNMSLQLSLQASPHEKYGGFQGGNIPPVGGVQKGLNQGIYPLHSDNLEGASIVSEPVAPYGKRVVLNDVPIISIEVQEATEGAICMVIDTGAAAGWPGAVNSPEWYQSLPQFRLPFFRSGEFICIPAIGDSMEPTLHNGEWVLARRILELNDVREGYVHVLLLKEGVLVKRVYARPTPGQLILRSDNPSYNAISVSTEDVLQLYKVEMFFSRSLGPQENNLHVHIARLEAEIVKIKKAIGNGLDGSE